MKQNAYLFVGGPLDGQFREVPGDRPGVVVAVEERTGEVTARMVRYYQVDVEVPGAWLVHHLTIYRADPVLGPEVGTPMPGWVEGQRPPATLIGPWRYVDTDRVEVTQALHAAVRRENARRMP